MNRISLLRIVFLTAALIVLAASARAQNAKKGQELFNTYSCYACHGYSGHGGNGPSLAPPQFDEQTFIAYVRRPARMPSYSVTEVPDAEMKDIYAYLTSIPASPKKEEIPLLQELPK